MQALPIDEILPELCAKVSEAGALVLEAPPGAGKTTRVPWAMHELLGAEANVLVSEPRRIAARMAAQRVASEHGERVGETVGYSVRFEEVRGPRTRIHYLTEGVLQRRLLSDPELRGVGAVILDEFHERHLSTDLLLVLLDRVRRNARPDLKLIVMSATLEAEPVARYLEGSARLRSEGRMFPVTIDHISAPDERPLEKQVKSALREILLRENSGDILVFLPGAPEIRRTTEALDDLGSEHDLLILPLHGDLPIAEQARAVEPARQRKVVLSTNVAESSLTIEGVTAVIDSGLARVAGHSPWTGLPTLKTMPISRASATQRAGRAGRTKPGYVQRLYTRGDFERRPEHDTPELLRSDLSEAWLTLHGFGVAKPAELRWLDAPPASATNAASELLSLLSAVDASGQLTEIGKRMLDFPLQPRLARLVVEGEQRGVAEASALLAALLGERDILLSERTTFSGRASRGPQLESGSSDLIARMERFQEAEHVLNDARRLSSYGLDGRSAQAVARAHKQLSRIVKNRGKAPETTAELDRFLELCILAACPDRVARRRKPGERDLILSTGDTAKLSESSVVHDALFLVAVDVEERSAQQMAGQFRASGVNVRLASAIQPDWLLEMFPDRVAVTDELVWNAEAERVEQVSRMSYGAVVLEESRGKAAPSEAAARCLVLAASAKGPEFLKSDAVESLLNRMALLKLHFPEAGFPELEEASLNTLLSEACSGLTSFAELRSIDLAGQIAFTLGAAGQRLLENEAPERLRLPGGRTVPVHYERDKPPWIESRLQDFFGMGDSPRVCRGRVPLTLHLLAPNQRAVQVTNDLAGFWERHYPTIRRELMRRYPRHSWPEDGRTAKPPEPKPRR